MAISDLEVVPATDQLVGSMADRLRHCDVAECMAAADMTGSEGLVSSYRASEQCWVVLWKGRATVCFGVVEQSPRIGTPWMLATDELMDMAYEFLLESPKWIETVRAPYALLMNWVDARNAVSIKWLMRMGFTIGGPRPYGPYGELFHPFWMKGCRVGHEMEGAPVCA
jgi:hypothetical protein